VSTNYKGVISVLMLLFMRPAGVGGEVEEVESGVGSTRQWGVGYGGGHDI
jgi:hypothetical protein